MGVVDRVPRQLFVIRIQSNVAVKTIEAKRTSVGIVLGDNDRFVARKTTRLEAYIDSIGFGGLDCRDLLHCETERPVGFDG